MSIGAKQYLLRQWIHNGLQIVGNYFLRQKLWHLFCSDSHLKVTEDDNSWVFIVPLLLFVLGIDAIPRNLEQIRWKTNKEKHQTAALGTMCIKQHDICFIGDGFQESGTGGMGFWDYWETCYTGVSSSLCSFPPFTDLISTGNFLHFPECGVELADEVVFPPGVIIPHEALWHTGTTPFTFSPLVWPQLPSVFNHHFNHSIVFNIYFISVTVGSRSQRASFASLPWACAPRHSCTEIWEKL